MVERLSRRKQMRTLKHQSRPSRRVQNHRWLRFGSLTAGLLRQQNERLGPLLSTRRCQNRLLCSVCPNITGTWGSYFEDKNDGYKSTGAVMSTAENTYYAMECSGESAPGHVSRSFSAARSSPVYGSASTVQPSALRSMLCIKI